MAAILVPLLGGLALFLYGMRVMGEGLEKAAGDRMRRWLEVITGRPITGVLVGAGVTSVIQSSSATTVMVVGFVNAGLMTLKQAIGVIMGANIGTTITAQLIAFKLSDYVMPIIAIGFGMFFLARRKRFKYLGQVILGFGILFLGLTTMADAMAPLKTYPGFTHAIVSFGEFPLFGVLIGTAMTALIQSSSATTGILIALASNGLIPFATAIPIILGCNIGTCVTAVIASVGTSTTARRAAAAHVTFNIIGTVIFLVIMPWFREFVLMISPPGDIARQIANAHTSFNVFNTLLFLPMTGVLEKIVNRIIPGEDEVVRRGPIHLDDRVLNSPSLSLSLANKEIIRMANFARDNLENSMRAFLEKDMRLVRQVYDYENIIDELEKEITAYLAKVAQRSLIPALSDKHNGLLHVVHDFERVADHAENIANLAEARVEDELPFSEHAIQELEMMQDYVMETLEKAIVALDEESKSISKEIIIREDKIDSMEKQLRESHIARLNAGRCYPASGVVFLEIISNLERVGDHSHNIAVMVLHSLLPESYSGEGMITEV